MDYTGNYKMKYMKLLFGVLCFSVMLVAPEKGNAQGKPVKKETNIDVIQEIDPLDFNITMTKDAFLENVTLHEEVPYGDERLAYKIYLPKSWKRISEDELNNGELDDVELNSRLLGEIVKYISPPVEDDHALFVIQALRMDKILNIEYWFRDYMSVKGLYIKGMKVFSPDLLHAEYDVFRENRLYSVRSVVQRNGARIIVSEYFIPSGMDMSRDKQRWAMTLFRLYNPNDGLDNLTKVYNYLNVASHLYPKNWEVIPGNYDSVHEIFATLGRLKIIDKGYGKIERYIEKPRGYVNTLLISKSVFSDVNGQVKHLLEEQKAKGRDVSSMEIIDRGKGKKDRTVAFSPIRAYRSATATGYEFWISYNETASSYFIVSMLMPDRRFNYMLWAENVAAFNLALGSFSAHR